MKKRGFSLLEAVVVIGIMALMISFGTLNIMGRSEKNAMTMVKSKVPEFMRVAAQRSFEEGKEYRVVIDVVSKVLRRKDKEGIVEEELFLPEVLTYVLGNGTDTQYEVKIDDTGHGILVGEGALNRNMFVFNSKGEALYKINMRDNTPLRYLIVKSYIPASDMDEESYNPGSWQEE